VAQRYRDHVKTKNILSAFLRGEESAVAEELAKAPGWKIVARGGKFKAHPADLKFDTLKEGFRIAKPKDVDPITRLINGAYDNFLEGRVSPRWVERDMFQPGWFNVLLEEKGEACALGCLILEDNSAEINWVSVLPSFQSKGLGRRVMNILLTEASKHELAEIKLCHASKTPWATDFYTGFGFRPEGSEIDFVAYKTKELPLISQNP